MLEAHDLRLTAPDGGGALTGLTIFAHPGDLLVLLGGHGAGKSAVLRAVAGLARPDRGTIRLDGADVTYLDPAARAVRGIAYVGDGGRVAEQLTVRDNLLVGAWRRRDRRAVRAQLSEWLDRFPSLAAAARRPAGLLDGSDRMAAALGRAWLARPRVQRVDEPFAWVGERQRAGIAAALRAASDAGRIVVCAVHDAADASIAQRINVLSAGRLIFSGSPAALATAGAAALE